MSSKKKTRKFGVLILTHGRAGKVLTEKTLRACGYTGDVHYLVDNEDSQVDAYRDEYGDRVTVFDKKLSADNSDSADNFNKRDSPLYARNVAHEMARQLGWTHFVQLDDDYTRFDYRIYEEENGVSVVRKMDAVFDVLCDFIDENESVKTIAIAQGGDFIGGKDNVWATDPTLTRKAMNSFVCKTDRPFKFIGRLNDDVSTYVVLGSRGQLFFTFPRVSLTQMQTQKQDGGITGAYLESGTYVKSFYTVMMQPSSVKVTMLGQGKNSRLHHFVDWKRTVPKIVPESCRKKKE